MAKAEQNEVCDNCGKVIGKLETPHLHDGHIVCRDCKMQLAPVAEYQPALVAGSGKPKRTALYGVAALSTIGVAAVAAFLFGHSQRSAAPTPTTPLPTPVVAVAPSQSPLISAIVPASKGAIAGSIWIERKDGSSVSMRGVRVELIKPDVSAKTYYDCIKSQLTPACNLPTNR